MGVSLLKWPVISCNWAGMNTSWTVDSVHFCTAMIIMTVWCHFQHFRIWHFFKTLIRHWQACVTPDILLSSNSNELGSDKFSEWLSNHYVAILIHATVSYFSFVRHYLSMSTTWPEISSIWNSPIYCNINTEKVSLFPALVLEKWPFCTWILLQRWTYVCQYLLLISLLILAAARAVPGSLYGRGPPIILAEVSCNVSEFTISQCNITDFGRITNQQCSSPDNVAGVNCSRGSYHQLVACMQCVCCGILVTKDVWS